MCVFLQRRNYTLLKTVISTVQNLESYILCPLILFCFEYLQMTCVISVMKKKLKIKLERNVLKLFHCLQTEIMTKFIETLGGEAGERLRF